MSTGSTTGLGLIRGLTSTMTMGGSPLITWTYLLGHFFIFGFYTC